MRASIVIPMQNPARAVEEISRWADDRRFVQVLMPAMHDLPYGRRYWWPIFEQAERLDLPIGLHLGSAYRRAITAVGWPSYHVEDYVDQTQGMQAQLASMLSHGVFVSFPRLKLVLIESGVSWVPAFCWRMSKFWRGLRIEVPWVDRAPVEIVREHVRLTLAAVRRAADGRRGRAPARASGLRRHAAVLLRLPALALRWRRRAAGRVAGCPDRSHVEG